MHEYFRRKIVSLHEEDTRSYVWKDKTNKINFYCKLKTDRMMRHMLDYSEIDSHTF